MFCQSAYIINSRAIGLYLLRIECKGIFWEMGLSEICDYKHIALTRQSRRQKMLSTHRVLLREARLFATCYGQCAYEIDNIVFPPGMSKIPRHKAEVLNYVIKPMQVVVVVGGVNFAH
jgi:hypothetical protein